MHYFESQLISKVKLVEENDQRIVFSGHYIFGDGASIPLGCMLVSYIVFFIYYYECKHWGLFAFAVFLIVVSIPFLVFKKKVSFNLDSRELELRTRSIFGSRKRVYTFEESRIKAKPISIRMADNCGALDLVLPDTTIRLHISGHIKVVKDVADGLAKRTGIRYI